ncbi:hypothetical protein [Marinomonas primoryensis]|uniref:Glycosyl transferase n=1 Tax=Marinomonas primoryensis TaxID=178399 RepID=A0ABV0KYV2_9GAMM
MDKIRVFVAATPAEWLPARVLEFSISEQTSTDVDVHFLYRSGIDIPMPLNINNRPRTPFSFQRFLIPELCQYSGRAIYFDADMQVFQDVTKLWNHSFLDTDLQTVQEAGGRRGQFSVMLLDCEKLGWSIGDIVSQLDSGELDYASLMYEMKVAKRIGSDIEPSWNSLESFEAGVTKLLHYTDMNTQPWVSLNNPLGYLWVSCLRRAIISGFITREEVECEVKAQNVRPSLLAQLDANIDNPQDLPRNIKKMDRVFLAPYKKLKSKKNLSLSLFFRKLKYKFGI